MSGDFFFKLEDVRRLGGTGGEGLKLRSLASRSDFEWRVKKEGTFVSVGRAECE